MHDWLNSLIQLAVAVGTLILACMAYKQIKENRLIENVKIHSNDLKEFLRQWKEKYLLKIPPAESDYKCYNPAVVLDEPPTFDEPTKFSFTIKENLLYEDIRNHLPSEYNKLNERWSEYKELIRSYDEKRKNLLENIKNDLDRTKKTTFPAVSIYARAVSLGLKGILCRASIYDYSVEKRIDYILKYGTHEKYWVYDTVSTTMVPDDERESEIAKLRADHENISKDYNIKYKEEIKEILTIERNLIERREEISIMLEDIILIPNLPKECKYIKNALK
jgi:hypothetical protein